ncbi:hypothetical protein LS73_003230 [Helicobacter muridarum]|uniref:Uncharacterized protein n=1 Tax=Helicobacter muridarum TaxID=216 RepID=A0A099TY88_9HELI|nr:hypothetical protein [Helicobacter muridarum]TLE00925.1 hypothetical protein LS73_003230 [Helicobacter muridarum]STQ86703.1 Uncharacterised protein [Helicobacter muridarum]
MTINNNPAIVVEKLPSSKDSLKLADTQKSFSIVDIVPNSIQSNQTGEDDNSSQIDEILSTMKALHIARKSLSDVQSIVKDMKNNYKVEARDEWLLPENNMLKQRYNAMLEIKRIFENAKYNQQNVFSINYADKNINLNFERNNLSNLNLRDGHSIDIFSYNIDMLSKDIDKEIGNLQSQIDSIKQSRWLSMQQLKTIPLEQKETKQIDNNTNQPNLASLLSISSNKEQLPASNIETKDENNTIDKSSNPNVSKIYEDLPNLSDSNNNPIQDIKSAESQAQSKNETLTQNEKPNDTQDNKESSIQESTNMQSQTSANNQDENAQTQEKASITNKELSDTQNKTITTNDESNKIQEDKTASNEPSIEMTIS